MSSLNGVWAIVLNFNQADRTRACVSSLLSGSVTPERILVVDNGPTETPGLSESEWSPMVRYHRLETNTGFAGGNNAGIRKALGAGALYIWVLNNDTTVDTDCLKSLLKACKPAALSVVAPLIRNHHDLSVWFAGGVIDTKNGFVLHSTKLTPDVEALEVGYAVGCSLFATATTWSTVGGFDESLFLYWEDVDWNLRLSREGGKAFVAVGAGVIHDAGGSSVRSSRSSASVPLYYKARNRLIIARRRDFALLSVILSTPRWVVRELRSATLDLERKPNLREMASMFRGLMAGMFGRIPARCSVLQRISQ